MSQVEASDTKAVEGVRGLTPFIEPSLINALPHYLPLGIFPLIVLALIHGGWWLLPPFLFMSVAGPADKLLGPDGRNIEPKGTSERRLRWHNIPVWTWAFLWPPTLVFGMWQILVANPFAVWEECILVVILTMEAQAVFVVGHELVHRRSKVERRIAEFLLASASYPQYATEHVYIHHAKVGTPDDAGSAPKGESFWRYFPKEVASNLTNSWQSARWRLARNNRPLWHYTNPFWRYGLALLFWYGLTYLMGGLWAVLLFIALGFGCVFSMKIINYCQHYGLRRVRLPNGRWEKVMPRHSWDADWKFSNWMFFKMQRHSDHHAMAGRHYPLLQVHSSDESPQLPGTYSDMMNLVLRPKRWFETMDPLVDQWRAHFYPEIDDWRAYDSPLAAARPDAFDAIIEIYGYAPRLALWIERNPELLDNLQQREFTDLDLPKGFGPDEAYETTARRGLTRLYWTYEMGVAEMREQIDELPSADAVDTVEIVRNWSNDKAFQIGMHLIRKNLSPMEAATAMAHLAEAMITSVIAAVLADHTHRYGQIVEGGFAAMLVGDLANKQAYSGMPLRVVFIHSNKNAEQWRRLAEQCHAQLLALTQDSLVFDPTGPERTPLESRVLSEFTHANEDPRTQDGDFLLSSRCVFRSGESDLAQHIHEHKQAILAELRKDIPAQASSTKTTEVSSEPSVNSFVHAKLEMIEDIARSLRLQQSEEESDIVLSAQSIFNQHDRKDLAQAAGLFRSVQSVQRFICEESSELENTSKQSQSCIANACEHSTFEELTSALHDAGNVVEHEFNSLLEQPTAS
ncbi:MAG: hypothetical protein F4W90_08805 [Gammaproteobacteria bacterium]|nr:hypothetical protein [Gammaproteobacteria bacterium]